MSNSHSPGAFAANGAADSETVWDFVPADPDAGSALTEDPELERYLVEEIARAKRRRPLMKRLERVEAAYSELPARIPGTATPLTPPPLPSLDVAPEPPSPADVAPIDQLMEEFGGTVGAEPPASAEWLEKAQRERSSARWRNLFAWIATLAIGAAIIAATVQGLQP